MTIVDTYNLIAPPFDFKVDFRSMTHRQAKEYFDWYISEIPFRLDLLKDVAKLSDNMLDVPFNTLPRLGALLDENASLSRYTDEELSKERARMPEWFKPMVPAEVLSELTISLCIDIGMYFGSAFIRRHPHLEWDVVFKPKNYVDYHRPILKGMRSGVDFSPQRLAIVVGNKVVRGGIAAEELPRLIPIWDELA